MNKTFFSVTCNSVIIGGKQRRKPMLKYQIEVLLVKRGCCLPRREARLKLGLLQHILVMFDL